MLLRTIARLPTAFILVMLAACGATSHSSDDSSAAAGPSNGGPSGTGADDAAPAAGACVTIPQEQAPAIPHVAASGAKAAAVWTALEAVLAAETPKVMTASSYTLPTLQCGEIAPPMGPSGYQCAFTVQATGAPDGGALASITLPVPSPLAEDLLNAFIGAGASSCGQGGASPESLVSISLAHVNVSSTGVAFDDLSQESLPPLPNAVVGGPYAAGIISAFMAAGVDDCDARQTFLLVCTRFSATAGATCGAIWSSVDAKTGLVPLCDANTIDAGPSAGSSTPLTATQSEALWTAILAGASSIGFKPLDGQVSDATVMNANFFTRQGSSLAFQLTLDNVAPPPGAGGP